MSERSGVGPPPEDCTCRLVKSLHVAGPGVGFGPHQSELHWSVHIADVGCPHHGERQPADSR